MYVGTSPTLHVRYYYLERRCVHNGYWASLRARKSWVPVFLGSPGEVIQPHIGAPGKSSCLFIAELYWYNFPQGVPFVSETTSSFPRLFFSKSIIPLTDEETEDQKSETTPFQSLFFWPLTRVWFEWLVSLCSRCGSPVKNTASRWLSMGGTCAVTTTKWRICHLLMTLRWQETSVWFMSRSNKASSTNMSLA